MKVGELGLACDHRGRIMFVSVKTKEGNLVAHVRQHAMLRESGLPGVPTRSDSFATHGPGPPVDPPDGVEEMEIEKQRREAAPAARRRVPQRSAMVIDHAQLLLEFGAVYAWKPRDRVIAKRLTKYLARGAVRFLSRRRIWRRTHQV